MSLRHPQSRIRKINLLVIFTETYIFSDPPQPPAPHEKSWIHHYVVFWYQHEHISGCPGQLVWGTKGYWTIPFSNIITQSTFGLKRTVVLLVFVFSIWMAITNDFAFPKHRAGKPKYNWAIFYSSTVKPVLCGHQTNGQFSKITLI